MARLYPWDATSRAVGSSASAIRAGPPAVVRRTARNDLMNMSSLRKGAFRVRDSMSTGSPHRMGRVLDRGLDELKGETLSGAPGCPIRVGDSPEAGPRSGKKMGRGSCG